MRPYVVDNRFTGELYFNFLRESLTELSEDVPLHVSPDMWFHHDGATAHCCRAVTKFLNARFTDPWKGRQEPIA